MDVSKAVPRRHPARGSLAVLVLVSSIGVAPAAQDAEVRLRQWAAAGQTDAVRKRLAERDKVVVDAPDEAGWTALMHAAGAGHAAMVGLLLDAGASVALRNRAQETALHLAAQQGSTEVVRLLLAAGADFAARDGEGRTPLFRAIDRGRAEVVKLLHTAALASFNRRSPAPAVTEGTTTPPKLVQWDEASYPAEALKQRIEGTVVLMVLVARDGSVTAVSVSKGVEESLDRSAQRAVRNWRFEPATRDGRSVNVVLEIRVDFKLPAVPRAAATSGDSSVPAPALALTGQPIQ
jgi:TonB family protein